MSTSVSVNSANATVTIPLEEYRKLVEYVTSRDAERKAAEEAQRKEAHSNLVGEYKSVLLNSYSSISSKSLAMKFINDNREFCISQMDTLMSNDNRTALHYACSNNHIEIAEFFIKAGADIGKVDYYGQTPLHNVCQNRLTTSTTSTTSTTITQLLIEAGADTEKVDKYGNTPLLMACHRGNYENVKLLIKAKADVNCSDNNGSTPLHLSSHAIIKLLIEAGADVNKVNSKGNTPLSSACLDYEEYSDDAETVIETVMTLIDNGASDIVNGKSQIVGVLAKLIQFYYDKKHNEQYDTIDIGGVKYSLVPNV